MILPDIVIAIMAGLGAMLGWGFADFFAKKTIDELGDVTTLFWVQFIGVFPILALFLYNPIIPATTNLDIIFIGILGIWSGLSYVPTYIAFGKGKVSLLSPIFASYAVVVMLFSVVFLGEALSLSKQISLLVVFIGVLLISGDPREIVNLLRHRSLKTSEDSTVKGLKEIFLAIFLYSLWLISLDTFLGDRYWVPYLLGIRIFSAIALFFYIKSTRRYFRVMSKKLWKFLILIGVFDVAAFGFVSFGFSATSHVGIVAMLSGAFSLPTIILARVFLKERATFLQTIGCFVAIAGVVMLSLL